MKFRLYNCDFGVTVNGTNYDFDHVKDVVVEDPEETTLSRGANAGNKTGIVTVSGLTEPKVITLTVMNVEADLYELLVKCYKEKTRVEAYIVDRDNGSSRIAKKAVLQKEPMQLSINEDVDSLDIALSFATFDLQHKIRD